MSFMHSERCLYSRTVQKYQNNTYAHVPAPDCHLFFSIYLPSLFYSLCCAQGGTCVITLSETRVTTYFPGNNATELSNATYCDCNIVGRFYFVIVKMESQQ